MKPESKPTLKVRKAEDQAAEQADSRECGVRKPREDGVSEKEKDLLCRMREKGFVRCGEK